MMKIIYYNTQCIFSLLQEQQAAAAAAAAASSQLDISSARLGALGALDGNDLLESSTINYEDLMNSATAGSSYQGQQQQQQQQVQAQWIMFECGGLFKWLRLVSSSMLPSRPSLANEGPFLT